MKVVSGRSSGGSRSCVEHLEKSAHEFFQLYYSRTSNNIFDTSGVRKHFQDILRRFSRFHSSRTGFSLSAHG